MDPGFDEEPGKLPALPTGLLPVAPEDGEEPPCAGLEEPPCSGCGAGCEPEPAGLLPELGEGIVGFEEPSCSGVGIVAGPWPFPAGGVVPVGAGERGMVDTKVVVTVETVEVLKSDVVP